MLTGVGGFLHVTEIFTTSSPSRGHRDAENHAAVMTVALPRPLVLHSVRFY